MFFGKVSIAQVNKDWSIKGGNIRTRWSDSLNPELPLPEYPRPNMKRNTKWVNLNGIWDFVVNKNDSALPKEYNGKILVPFPIESSLSGVKRSLTPNECLWYRKRIAYSKDGRNILLHFGAVDWSATVYVNGKLAGSHKGGYSNFVFNVSNLLVDGINEIVVCVKDPTDKGFSPHGKQSLNPANIYYTASSGIWQTVWLEEVPKSYIKSVKVTSDIDNNKIMIAVDCPDGFNLVIEALDSGKIVKTEKLKKSKVCELKIDHPKLWSPEQPHLYYLAVKLLSKGKIVDSIESYIGMRKISIGKDDNGYDRIFLNNKYYYNLGLLDQGFWPDGLYTAPTDSALLFDIIAAKAMGFNTIRKHIKIEPARWYYHADKIGILVWQDLVNPNQGLPKGSKKEFENESLDIINSLYNYCSITTWVLFNEKWGQYDQERLTRWLKEVDPNRIVNGHSGEFLYVDNKLRSPSANPYPASDLTDVHSYPFPRNSIRIPGKAQVCGEFGGIAAAIDGHVWDDVNVGWGYDGLNSVTDLQRKYKALLDTLKLLEKGGLSASIYTQPYDVEGELNGLLTYDRVVSKIPINIIERLNSVLYNPTERSSYDLGLKDAESIQLDLADALSMYRKGSIDSAKNRKLIIMLKSTKNQSLKDSLMESYLSKIKNPNCEQNLLLFSASLGSSIDKMFKWMIRGHTIADSILGNTFVSNRIKSIIYNEDIKPKVEGNNFDIDWGSIERNVKDKYGNLGELIFLRSKSIYHLNHQQWQDFSIAAKTLISINPKEFSTNELNDLSWTIFENVSDTSILKVALSMVKLAINDDNSAAYYDTYANIYYKMGFKDKALQLQRIALTLPADDQSMVAVKENYEKMLKGIPTWNEK